MQRLGVCRNPGNVVINKVTNCNRCLPDFVIYETTTKKTYLAVEMKIWLVINSTWAISITVINDKWNNS